MGKLIFILGGARSGKSSFAHRLALERDGRVVFIATAQAGDLEMKRRIAAHQAQRPNSWITLECPVDVAGAWNAFHAPADLAIVDCLTFLVTNLLLQAAPDLDHPEEDQAAALVKGEIEALLGVIQDSQNDWIVVSNEVGMGLVPAYPVGRLFRDLLGWANQRMAEVADQVFYLVAGIPLPIHPYRLSSRVDD